MSRISISNLNSVSNLSREEMTQAVGGLRVVCGLQLKLVTIRVGFFTIRVPRLVFGCRVVR